MSVGRWRPSCRAPATTRPTWAMKPATRDLVAAVAASITAGSTCWSTMPAKSIRIPHADLKAATPAVWRRMLDINLIAPFVLIAEAEPALRKSAESGPAGLHRQHRHACRRAAQGRLDSLRHGQGGPASRHAPAGAEPGAGHPGQLRGARPRRDADGRGLARGDRALEHQIRHAMRGPRNPRTSPIWWPRWSPTTTLRERSSSPTVG